MRARWWMAALLIGCTEGKTTPEVPDTADPTPTPTPVDADTVDTAVDTDLPPLPEDRDDDGTPDDEDCAPDDPTIHPGAVDTCDGVDRDCDGIADQLNAVWWEPDSGPGTDLTPDVLAAAPEVPLEWDAPGPGTLHLCPGSHAISIRTDGHDITIRGTGDDRDLVEIDVLGGGRALFAVGGAHVAAEGLTIRAGAGSLTPAPVANLGVGTSLSMTRCRVKDSLGDVGTIADAAVVRLERDVVLTVDDCVVESLDAFVDAVEGSTVTLTDTDFENLTSAVGHFRGDVTMTDVFVQGRGGIVLDGADATLTHVSISDGGDPSFATSPIALEMRSPSTLDWTDASIRNWSGRAFVLQGDVTIAGLEVVRVENPSAEPLGHVAAGTVAISDLSALSNVSVTDGGVLSVAAGADLTCDTCTFTTNNTGGRGGAIHTEGALHLVDVDAGNNQAPGNGGAIHLDGGSLDIVGGSFRDNVSVDGDGGALYLAPAAASRDVTCEDCTFATNSATRGGAVYGTTTRLVLTGGELTTNTADEGGGVWIRSTLDATGTGFFDNQATVGGAIHGQQVLLTQCNLQRNTASGSAGAVKYTSSLLLTDTSFGANPNDNRPEDLETTDGTLVDLEGTLSGPCTASGCAFP